jgi:hypothetical protein
MADKRPCSVCGKWFRPDARQGDRQKTCGCKECKSEWHRRACARWHKKNPGYDKDTRLVRRLVKDSGETKADRRADPLKAINWPLAREEIGLKVSILVEESLKAFLHWAREAMLV